MYILDKEIEDKIKEFSNSWNNKYQRSATKKSLRKMAIWMVDYLKNSCKNQCNNCYWVQKKFPPTIPYTVCMYWYYNNDERNRIIRPINKDSFCVHHKIDKKK